MKITYRKSNFVLPGTKSYPAVTTTELWNGVVRASSREQRSYSKIANIQWASGPMITFTTEVKYGVWARAWIRGWGHGTIKYSTHPDTMKGWADFRKRGIINDVLLKLAFHELGHVVANTMREDIGYPPKQWLVDRLVAHYGKPKVKAKKNSNHTPDVTTDDGILLPAGDEAVGGIAGDTPGEIVIELPLDDLSWLQ